MSANKQHQNQYSSSKFAKKQLLGAFDRQASSSLHSHASPTMLHMLREWRERVQSQREAEAIIRAERDMLQRYPDADGYEWGDVFMVQGRPCQGGGVECDLQPSLGPCACPHRGGGASESQNPNQNLTRRPMTTWSTCEERRHASHSTAQFVGPIEIIWKNRPTGRPQTHTTSTLSAAVARESPTTKSFLQSNLG